MLRPMDKREYSLASEFIDMKYKPTLARQWFPLFTGRYAAQITLGSFNSRANALNYSWVVAPATTSNYHNH